MEIIFGPVTSRRFGTSLGIDLSPTHKQCNFDCLYCELAPAATVTHQEQSPSVAQIVSALEAALAKHPHIDVITLTANGEPTLYPYLNELIDAVNTVKKRAQTLILTNSASLADKEIFQTLLKCDQVKLSLDAISPDIFQKIDRPHASIDILHIKDAVIEFSQHYQGKLFIEILFVHKLNDTPEEIALLNETLLHVNCERIDIGTIDRPPAYPVSGISYSELHAISQQFDSELPVHIASRLQAQACQSHYSTQAILNTLDKRPLTRGDIALLFDNATQQRLEALVKSKKVTEIERAGMHFFVPSENLERKRSKILTKPK